MKYVLAVLAVLLVLVFPSSVYAVNIDVTATGQGGDLTPPTIVVTAATDVTSTSARLNGNLTSDGGGGSCNVTVFWGETNEGEVPGSWDHNSVPTSPAQPQSSGVFYLDISGLSSGTVYYYIARAVNTLGTDWSTVMAFTAQSGCVVPGDPVDLVATLSSDGYSISLSWTVGSSSDNTVVVVSTSGYPTGIGDGTTVYYGSADNTTYTIPIGEIDDSYTYYFSAWSSNDCGLSTGSASASVGGSNHMLLIALIGLACFFTFFSAWRRYLPSSMAGAIAWLALAALWLVTPSTIGVTSTSTWTPYIGFVFVLATIVPIMLYLKPLTTMSKTRGGITWQEQAAIPKDKETRGQKVQREYKERMRSRIAEGRRKGNGSRRGW